MDQQQDTLGFLLADVARLMRHSFQQRIADSALTLAQARALVYISRNEGISQVQLARLLEVTPITLARLIDQLVEAGVVERRPDPADRRAHRLFLTDAAGHHLQAIKKVGQAIRVDALKGLDEEQIATVTLALETIRNNLGEL